MKHRAGNNQSRVLIRYMPTGPRLLPLTFNMFLTVPATHSQALSRRDDAGCVAQPDCASSAASLYWRDEPAPVVTASGYCSHSSGHAIQAIRAGLVKWYNRPFVMVSWGFDSLIRHQFPVPRFEFHGSSDCIQTINVLEQEFDVLWCG